MVEVASPTLCKNNSRRMGLRSYTQSCTTFVSNAELVNAAWPSVSKTKDLLTGGWKSTISDRCFIHDVMRLPEKKQQVSRNKREREVPTAFQVWSKGCYLLGLYLVIFVPWNPRPAISPFWLKKKA